MEKIKNFFLKMSKLVLDIYKKYPITTIVVYLTTLIIAFGFDDFLDTFYDEWFPFIGVFIIGTVFVETEFKNSKLKGVGVALAGLVAIIFKAISNMEEIPEYVSKLMVAYMVATPTLTIYRIMKDSELSFSEYVSRVFCNFIRCSCTYLLAVIGISIVVLAFDILLFDGDLEILGKLQILLVGFYYIPAQLSALTDMSQPAGKFMRRFVLYILTPVVSFLILIIYLFIFKTILKDGFEDLGMFAIATGTFYLGLPLIVLLKNYIEENKGIKTLHTVLIGASIPMIIMQAVAILIRINQYALTDQRYECLIIVIFEAIYLGLIIYKDSKYLKESVLIACAIFLLVTLTPLEPRAVSLASQSRRLEKTLDNAATFSELSNDDKDECKEIVDYITGREDDYLENKFSADVLAEIESHKYVKEDDYFNYLNDYEDDDEEESEPEIYLYETRQLKELDVSKYSKIYEISSSKWNKRNGSVVEIHNRDNDIEFKLDFKEIVDDLIYAKKIEKEDELFDDLEIIKIDDGKYEIYLTKISFRANEITGELLSLNIEGYILECAQSYEISY